MRKGLLFVFLLLLISCKISAQNYNLNFDGTNDYVDCGDDATLRISGIITVEAWVSLDTDPADVTNQYGSILGKFNWTASNYSGYVFYRSDNNTVGFRIDDGTGSTKNVNSTTQMTRNTWYHVAASYDLSNLKIYVNGNLEATVASTIAIGDIRSNLCLGTRSVGAQQNLTFKGKIDEIRIWNITRTVAEIKTNIFKEISTNSNLKAYYKMTEGSGATLTDNSGFNNTGTLTNAPVWQASGCFAGPRNALHFDGVDDYVDCGSPLATRITNNLTITAWVKAESSTGWRDILTNQWLINSGGIIIASWGPTGNLHYAITGNGGAFISRDPPSNLLDAKWHHIAITFASGVIRTYLDGVLIDTYNSPITSIIYNGTSKLMIGLDSGTLAEQWKGYLDEIAIWSVVCSEAEIRENMMKTLTGNETGLAAYYRMDQYDGTTLYDLTTNGLNGALYNMTPASDWVASDAFNTWIGSENSTFSTAANWSKSNVPSSTDNIGIYKWTSLGNDCTVSSSPTANSLFISSTSNPTLSSGLTINSNLLLGRNLDLNSQTITLGSTGYLSEGSYRLYGSAGTITTTRTLSGISALNVAGLGAILTTSANMGNTVISRGHAEQISGSAKSILRYFDITPTTNTGLNATLVFNYNDLEFNGLTESNFTLFKSTNSGSNWTNESGTLDISNNKITKTGIAGFSRWTVGDNNSPLPVELTNFYGTKKGYYISLFWQTATESNNYGFQVERRNQGSTGNFASQNLNWEPLGFVQGHGNSNSPKYYSYVDFDNENKGIQYRLKQIDNDGKFQYSKLAEISIVAPSQFVVYQNYPNPFNPSTTIQFGLPEKSDVSIVVFNQIGEIVATLLNQEKEAGYHHINWNASELSSGIYYCKIKAGMHSAIKKLVLLK